jgi:hypothetical protein
MFASLFFPSLPLSFCGSQNSSMVAMRGLPFCPVFGSVELCTCDVVKICANEITETFEF